MILLPKLVSLVQYLIFCNSAGTCAIVNQNSLQTSSPQTPCGKWPRKIRPAHLFIKLYTSQTQSPANRVFGNHPCKHVYLYF